MRKSGTYQILSNREFFIPHDLPPTDPTFELSPEILALYGEASFALGKLNEAKFRLPDPQRFVRAYIIKEALLSSAIENIHTTLLDVFTSVLENAKPNKNTQLVLNYMHALEAALHMIRDEDLPIDSHVILKAHKILMSVGEGDYATPGFYRLQPVRVGNLIPAPPLEVPRLMEALAKYMNEPSEIPPLIRAGLTHVQFETIHPFLDGNGRIGRLLIVLMLINDDLLTQPILYPSYFFKKYRFEYYHNLDRVRTHGDFEGWTIFYLTAIRDSALDAYARAKEIEALEAILTSQIQNDPSLAKVREVALQTLNYLFTQPVTSITQLSKDLDKSYNTASSILKTFQGLKIVTEDDTKKRGRLYRFDAYLHLLEKEY